uniref:Uncharacterized protein n=1 Tax=Anopheles atroparvus TaxID=41427 RepID=A0AAG5DUQ1_ANOAO
MVASCNVVCRSVVLHVQTGKRRTRLAAPSLGPNIDYETFDDRPPRSQRGRTQSGCIRLIPTPSPIHHPKGKLWAADSGGQRQCCCYSGLQTKWDTTKIPLTCRRNVWWSQPQGETHLQLEPKRNINSPPTM